MIRSSGTGKPHCDEIFDPVYMGEIAGRDLHSHAAS
jgi:hypothetical protein